MNASDVRSARHRLEDFLHIVSEMFERADFLLPVVAGQRQFRQDNYQMASASQLEDLFHDALGMFLRENYPRLTLQRRLGRELWDYALDDLMLSHKESQTPDFAVWWTGGEKSNENYAPLRASWNYDYPIIFVYTGTRGRLDWKVSAVADSTNSMPLSQTGTFHGLLGVRSLKNPAIEPGKFSLGLLSPVSSARFRIQRVWPAGAWEDLSFHDLWPELGGPGISQRDLWLDRAPKTGKNGLAKFADVAEGMELDLASQPLLPGIYAFPQEELASIPLVANNRAHSCAPGFVESLMRRCQTEGHFIPLPLWYMHFAESLPPNLYARQREQFEQLFAPRQGREPRA